MTSSTRNPSPNPATLDAADKANLTYLSKFGLSLSVAQHINSRLILNDIHIDDSATASDIKLNLWVRNYLEGYQLSPRLVIHMILEVFCEMFYELENTEFSRLD